VDSSKKREFQGKEKTLVIQIDLDYDQIKIKGCGKEEA
jgi:hypothetical protein